MLASARFLPALAVLLATASLTYASRPLRGSNTARCLQENPTPDHSYASLPGSIPTDNFCNATQFNNPAVGALRLGIMCTMIGEVEQKLLQLPPTAECPGMPVIIPPINTSISGQSLPTDKLEDMRPLPQQFHTTNIETSEGGDFSWYFRVVSNLAKWSTCKVAQPSITNSFVPAGWSLVGDVISVGAPIELNGSWPIAAVLMKGGKMVIVIRGTQTPGEWLADFTYNQTTTSLLTGSTHVGFTNIANILWEGGVQAALDQLVTSNGGDLFSLAVTGHSLGAGVATILSAMAANYLKQVQHSNIQVDAILFAPPEAGDADFAADFDQIVNGRSIKFANDLVPQIPCTPQMIACPKTPIPTGPLGTSWAYDNVGGQILLKGANMPVQPDAWSGFKYVPTNQTELGLFVSASHICSYMCYFSGFTNDQNNLCGLWQSSAVTSYCNGYPVTGYPAQA